MRSERRPPADDVLRSIARDRQARRFARRDRGQLDGVSPRRAGAVEALQLQCGLCVGGGVRLRIGNGALVTGRGGGEHPEGPLRGSLPARGDRPLLRRRSRRRRRRRHRVRGHRLRSRARVGRRGARWKRGHDREREETAAKVVHGHHMSKEGAIDESSVEDEIKSAPSGVVAGESPGLYHLVTTPATLACAVSPDVPFAAITPAGSYPRFSPSQCSTSATPIPCGRDSQSPDPERFSRG